MSDPDLIPDEDLRETQVEGYRPEIPEPVYPVQTFSGRTADAVLQLSAKIAARDRELLACRAALRKLMRFSPSNHAAWIRGVDKAEMVVGCREFYAARACLPEHREVGA